ncbi:hypothetical protein [Brevundimonas sp. DS20]|uniref:hypothetical protein n=1 Tax=Brevundimonas sp. DS20 TaxID=1532555 RepID=UPI0006D1DC9C|nr:hypothetical protein [Brevundimonas sp. DS20]ALJ09072.1 hypothetical protein JL11_12535 [Brevundimonas sp. DS20]
MQDHQAELIDLDLFCEIMEESVIIEAIREGELYLHFLKHPVRGFLTGIHAGSAVLMVEGGYADLRERAFMVSDDPMPETP